MKRVALLVVVVGGVAHAGPTARFGINYGLHDDAAAGETEIGPLVAVGERFGGLVGEVEWSYLSFFDPMASPGGVHRLGLTLRADLFRHVDPPVYRPHSDCTIFDCFSGHGFYAEAGAAERFGHWLVDASHIQPYNTPQPEAHVGLGFELNNRVDTRRDGWQLGFRFAVARPDFAPGVACRGCAMGTTAGGSGGLEKAVFMEWMFLIGE